MKNEAINHLLKFEKQMEKAAEESAKIRFAHCYYKERPKPAKRVPNNNIKIEDEINILSTKRSVGNKTKDTFKRLNFNSLEVLLYTFEAVLVLISWIGFGFATMLYAWSIFSIASFLGSLITKEPQLFTTKVFGVILFVCLQWFLIELL